MGTDKALSRGRSGILDRIGPERGAAVESGDEPSPEVARLFVELHSIFTTLRPPAASWT